MNQVGANDVVGDDDDNRKINREVEHQGKRRQIPKTFVLVIRVEPLEGFILLTTYLGRGVEV